MNNERSLAKEITEGFEALKSMRNNEPVVWIAVGDNTSVFFNLDCALSIDDNPTPLYTHPVKEEYESFDRTASHMAGEYVSHPVKELTDEEIKEVWMNRPANTAEGVIEFARAILRKAQEK